MLHIIRALLPILLLGAVVIAQDLKPIELPKPDMTGGKPLMQTLKDRHSTREFSSDTLPLPVLSDMLWAACGINRPEEGKRTAPSAMNWQEVDVYVATAHGLYLYDPAKHVLNPVLAGDIREKTGGQPFVKEAPVNLIYVSDFAKMSQAPDSAKSMLTAADAAFMGENVYLFCASAGLGVVIRASVDNAVLAPIMKLRPDQRVILAQTVGYPKK
ncbi:MAG: SagB/ThcOx family dehydrogenase [candidate division Zixibacteria bacterium]|nr:SagB/ThcOx family dehydrogenase [candidate division Zixibacteria bacterium]